MAVRRVTHLTFTPLENDLRVKTRIAQTEDAGLETSVVELPLPMTPARKISMATLYRLGALGGGGSSCFAMRQERHMQEALRQLRADPPDCLIAHDWDSLPVAAKLKDEGVPFLHDAHEFAPEMHAGRLGWRLLVQPAIARMQRLVVPRADRLITVSEAHGALMQATYGLKKTPLACYNMPDSAPLEFVRKRPRPAGDRSLLLHFHGGLMQHRGLEPAIDALAELPSFVTLRIVGPDRQSGYRDELMTRAQGLGVADRVEILPAVGFRELVELASDADFGLVLLPQTSRHLEIALPNKLFEYLYAGLSPIYVDQGGVSDFMAPHDTGLPVSDYSRNALVEALRGFLERIPSCIEASAEFQRAEKEKALGVARRLEAAKSEQARAFVDAVLATDRAPRSD